MSATSGKAAGTVGTAREAAAAGTHLLREGVTRVETLAERGLAWAAEKGPGVAGALLLLVAAWVLAGWLRRVILRAATRAHFDITLAKFLGNTVKWAVLFFAVITCLGTFGINTTGFAAVLGTAGLAIGLALQGNLSNLASGVLLLVFRPFKIGDSVIVAGQAGIVDGIDLFTTNLDTADNRRIIVPNGAIFGGVIENQTRHPTRQVIVTVPTWAGADLAAARAALLGAAEEVVRTAQAEGALTTPPPAVALTEITPAVVWQVSLWVRTPGVAAVRQRLLAEVKAAIDAAGIAVPPPVMDVRVVERGGAAR
ncbi:MAG: mechanosensitive ion channel family protein [Phycisphaerales bacterium]